MKGVTAILLLLLSWCTHCFADDDAEYAKAFFFEPFNPGWEKRWEYSKVKKYKGRFETVKQEALQDTAIQAPAANVHYGLATLFPELLQPRDGLVVQYELRLTQGHTCGGAYVKLLAAPPESGELNPRRLASKTSYSIMFGPDRCGPDARVHVILHAMHPQTLEVQEHHLMSAPVPKKDKLSHLYTLVLSNNMYKLLVDGADRGSGLLVAADFSPPLQPPENIPDPDHIKPEDWVEEEMMDDPAAVKPAGWDDRRVVPDTSAKKPMGWLEDEPPRIPDPSAEQPEDWDEQVQGAWRPTTMPNPACEEAVGCGPWKPPMVRNPHYKGPWIPPQVRNPAYKGPWKQHIIRNPSYYKVDAPLDLLPAVAGAAFELWTTDAGYQFDGLLVGRGQEGLDAAKTYLNKVWRPRHRAEYAAAVAAARNSSRPAGWRHAASNTLMDLADSQLLSGVKPRLEPLLQLCRDTPELAWGLLALPGTTLLLLVVARLWTRTAKAQGLEADGQSAAQVEGEEFEVDDAEWEAEQKRISREAAAAARQRQRPAAAAAAAAAVGAGNSPSSNSKP